MNYYIGIDGGGTKTEFVLTNENGEVLKRVLKGGSNPNDIGLENAVSILLQGLEETLNRKDIPLKNLYIFAGISGAGVSGNAIALSDRIAVDYPNIQIGSDLINAIETCMRGGNGVAVICGTGISCALCQDGEYTTVGGYGYLFEDGGSGYAYGRDAVKAVLEFEDGIGEKTVLSEYFYQKFEKSCHRALAELLQGRKTIIADLCPLVFKGMEAGDQVCRRIVEKNLEFTVLLIKKALRIYKQDSCNISFIGSITKELVFREKLKNSFGKDYKLIFGEYKPVYGALRQAVGLSGKICDETFDNNYIRTIGNYDCAKIG